MQKYVVQRMFVYAIIFLFVGVSLLPSIGAAIEEKSSALQKQNSFFDSKTIMRSPAPLEPAVVYVDDTYGPSTPGWGYDHFNNVQDGINAVVSLGTVYVYNGTYDAHLTVYKTIILLGEDRNTTILDGGNSGPWLDITANEVTLSGFKVVGTAIHLYASIGNTITDNNVSNNMYMGIYLDGSSGNTIAGNKVADSWNLGIYLEASNGNTITGNTVTNNHNKGIYLAGSNGNTITDNHIWGNWNMGISLDGSNGNTITGNNASSNANMGISLDGSNGNTITGNNASGNGNIGIFISGSNGNTITNDKASSNQNDGICLLTSSNNTIYHNNFINNTQNAYDTYTNYWYNETLHEGNYWSDFESNPGYPLTYQIPGGNNVDLYPLNIVDLIATAHGPYSGVVGEQIHFSGSANGGTRPYTWHWDFGNGDTANEKDLIYAYDTVGIYNVTLTVTDSFDPPHILVVSTTATITEPEPLRADAHGPYNAYVGDMIQFHGNATGGVPSYTYYWSFGNGNTANQKDPQYTYHTTGTYTVTLCVTDSKGHSATNTTTATIALKPVHNINKDTYYSLIQEAVYDANPGDTIHVDSGVYYENIYIFTPVTLIGEDRTSTIIDGSGGYYVVQLSVGNVTIRGFTICNSSPGSAGIYLYSNDNTITGNIITSNYNGIDSYSSINTYISNNTIAFNTNYGIKLRYNSNYTISDNIINSNTGNGINFKSSNSNTIVGNTISNNQGRGVDLYSGSSNNNKFYHNNFIANTLGNVRDSYSNLWDNGYPAGGNYWSDWSTYPDNYHGSMQTISGSDGIIDKGSNPGTDGRKPYSIPGGSNKDMYPLKTMYTPLYASTTGPYSAFVGDDIQFTGSATGGVPPYNWSWNFGDTTPVSQLQNPIHSYAQAGTYTITLTVAASYLGQSAVTNTTATITELPPLLADAQGPYAGTLNESVFFTGSATGGVPPYTFHWDFGDTTTSDEQNATHVYTTAANYIVTLTVTDARMQTTTSTTWITITEPPLPDITITNISVEYLSDSFTDDPSSEQSTQTMARLTATLINTGEADITTPFQVSFYGINEQDNARVRLVQIGTVEIPSLQIGETAEATLLWRLQPEIQTVLFIADSSRVVEENDESNNEMSIKLPSYLLWNSLTETQKVYKKLNEQYKVPSAEKIIALAEEAISSETYTNPQTYVETMKGIAGLGFQVGDELKGQVHDDQLQKYQDTVKQLIILTDSFTHEVNWKDAERVAEIQGQICELVDLMIR